MSREELLAMLDAKAGASELEVSDGQECDSVSHPVSKTALVLDEWSLRRGEEVYESSERIREMFGPLPISCSDPRQRVVKDAITEVADFHAAAFEPNPELAKRCEDSRRLEYMQALLETPEFQALHAETQLDEAASEIAAASFAEKWVELIKVEAHEDPFKRQMQCLKAAGGALKGAADSVSDMRDAQSALGVGNGNGNGAIPAAELAKMFKRVQGSHRLKRICELAGRYRRFAQAQQRKKVLHGKDDVVGVVLDNDVGRILPHELAALNDEDLELDILRRIVERQAMCREYRGIESRARGPIVVIVDESGSMGGEPIHTAKAMALALAWVARHQKRYCCLVGFSDGPDGSYCVIPPGRDNPEELMTWLEHFYGGGTTVDCPLVTVPAKWEEFGCPRGKTDVILITDAQVDVPDKIRQSFLAWKAAESVKLITLVLNSPPGDMAGVSDRLHLVRSLSLEEDAVAEAMGV